MTGVIRSDFWMIIIVLVALLACLYTIYSVGSYQQAINERWAEQWEGSGCVEHYNLPAIDYKFFGGYGNETDDQDQDT